MDSATLHREVIKLLIQVAWADKEIAAEERDHIIGLARGAELSEDDVREFEQALQDPDNLPAPNISLLKTYKQEVLRAAQVLIRRDNVISADEAQMLENIRGLLAD